MFNLVANAVKFTETGQIEVSASQVGQTEEAVTVRYAVKDTGIGISENQRRDIFDAFAQVDGSTTRRFGGNGVGLAICGRLVGAMGSKIQLVSALGEGSEFSFDITVPRASEAPPPLSESARILLIDANPISRTLFERHLGNRGHQITVDDDPPDEPFDLIVLNFKAGKGGMSRLDSCLAATRNHPAPRVIGVFDTPPTEELAARLDGSMSSPVNLREFDKLLDEALVNPAKAASHEVAASNDERDP